MDIKDILKKRRIEKQLTLDDVGRLVGVSAATISRWESGDIANMKRDKIVKLAKALDISPAIIMGWDEDNSSIKAALDFDQQQDLDLAIIQRERSKMSDKEKNKLMNILKANFDDYNWEEDDSGDIE